MAERFEFRFDGLLADHHQMDFYEAGRFQYDAARLMVKLDQFRRTGRFSQKITYQNNTRITLAAQGDGCFIIAALAPMAGAIAEAFVTAPIGLMWSYVVDRILKPTTNDDIRLALENNRDLIGVYRADIEEREETNRRTLDLLENRIARGDQLTAENTELRERLQTEAERRAYLEGERAALREISLEQDTKLVSMAAPLIKDMGVALRSSARTLSISADTDGNRRKLMFLNRLMASEIETALVDQESTLILVKIVQYNTETGWGKLRIENDVGLLSFNVPSDLKGELQRPLTRAMNEDQVYIECVFVRSARGIRQRAILLAMRDLDNMETGMIR
jgi:anion-transporting  ArsA/GET3 family ATPase